MGTFSAKPFTALIPDLLFRTHSRRVHSGVIHSAVNTQERRLPTRTLTLSVSLRHVTALSTPSTRTQVTTETTVSLNQGERITVHAGCSETHNAVCSTYASRASIALAFAVHTAPPAGRPALDGRCTLLYRTSQTHRHGAQPQLEMRSPLRFMCVCSRRLPLTQRRRPHSASRRLPPARSAHRLRIVFERCLDTKRARPH